MTSISIKVALLLLVPALLSGCANTLVLEVHGKDAERLMNLVNGYKILDVTRTPCKNIAYKRETIDGNVIEVNGKIADAHTKATQRCVSEAALAVLSRNSR